METVNSEEIVHSNLMYFSSVMKGSAWRHYFMTIILSIV